ncbi:unnamed protein product [Caenorhabditis sp. 36 PRJEB53466]|nr:unnamed protein product [Caenorhabditis sp. 36 PRJEB53466]
MSTVRFVEKEPDGVSLEIHSHPSSLPDSTLFSPGKNGPKPHNVGPLHLVRRDFISDANLSSIRAKTARHTQT